MLKTLKRFYIFMVNSGLDLIKCINTVKNIPVFLKDAKEFLAAVNKPFEKVYFLPCLSDRQDSGGTAKGHYFHQDLLVAGRIFKNNPEIHIDIGSRVDGFVAHVASFRKIEVIDIRDVKSEIPNIVFKRADFMQPLPNEMYNYADSVSCLHALEHFGLGRYGDKIDALGYEKGLKNIYKLCRNGGKAYISVPIGDQRVEFNAHRVFSVKYLLELFEKYFIVETFSYVDDKGNLHENEKLVEEKVNSSFGCHYGCGIFELRKK